MTLASSVQLAICRPASSTAVNKTGLQGERGKRGLHDRPGHLKVGHLAVLGLHDVVHVVDERQLPGVFLVHLVLGAHLDAVGVDVCDLIGRCTRTVAGRAGAAGVRLHGRRSRTRAKHLLADDLRRRQWAVRERFLHHLLCQRLALGQLLESIVVGLPERASE